MKNQAAMMAAFANTRGEKLTHEQLTLLTRIDANALITEISNEHDRDQREKSRRKGEKRAETGGVKDEAMVASGSSGGKNKCKFDPKRPIGLCWNCFQADHLKTDCKNTAGTPPTEAEAKSRLAKAKAAKGKGKETTHAVSAAHDDSDSSDGSWDAFFVREHRIPLEQDYDDVPELLDDSDNNQPTMPANSTDPTDDDDDPFREVSEEDVVSIETAIIALTVSRDVNVDAAVAQLEEELGTTLVQATNADGTPMPSIEYVDDAMHFFMRVDAEDAENDWEEAGGEEVYESDDEHVLEVALVDGDDTAASASDERVLLVDFPVAHVTSAPTATTSRPTRRCLRRPSSLPTKGSFSPLGRAA